MGVDLPGAGRDGVWPGTLGQVKIHCRWRTAAWWLWRTISSALDLGPGLSEAVTVSLTAFAGDRTLPHRRPPGATDPGGWGRAG